ncbi:MAG: hypothetical protein JOZ70_15745 [Pseudolabrys sp.]|nr:hypothetical protein [Pseudolabrys sp.]MBV9956693.1 hypothetical protein [Pseudolabrys sp.]
MGQALPIGSQKMKDPFAMAERVMEFSPASDAEALKILRASFPDAPLTLRVAALAFLTRKEFPTARL